MSDQPLVSIIIPCYNHGAYIQETINSVLNQSYKNIEIIIVNDGSDDENTLNILSKINNPVIKIINQENAGPSVARDKALTIAKGKYFVPLDSDDLIEKDTIAESVKILEVSPNIAVIYGDCQYFGERNELRKQEPFNITKLIKANTIALCSVIRTDAFIVTGGFDEFLSKKGLEDWDLWLMLFEKGSEFHYLNKTTFKIRVLNSSRTFQVANKNQEEIKSYIYKKHSELVVKEFSRLYHENKNLKNMLDYRIGNLLLKPVRWVKRTLFR